MNSQGLRQGLFFGFNSGIITTLGVLSSVAQVTKNPYVLFVTLLSMAISDGISEAYSLYFSKKAENVNDNSKEPLKSLIGVISTKIIVTMSFLLPLLFTKDLRMYKNLSFPIVWSMILLILIDSSIIKLRNEKIYDYLIPQFGIIIFLVVMAKFFN